MNEELVKERLAGLYDCEEPFTVCFSGKRNGGRNGFYRPADRGITIHERNFIDEDGRLNEPLLMYTALHELAHHIQYTEYGQTGARCHTKLFKAVFDGLLDKAEEAGVYKPVIDEELWKMIDEARKISLGIARLRRELGVVLARLNDACAEKGVRPEDMTERKAGISGETAKKCVKIASLDLPKDAGADIQDAIAGERDGDRRKAMAAAAQAGKSVALVKHAGAPSPSGKSGSGAEMENLLREKERLEKTIDTLKRRLRDVMERINNDAGLRRAADRRRE